MKIKPIGIIHSSFKTLNNVSHQSKKREIGKIEIFEEFKEGLKGIEEFKKIWIIFYFHESDTFSLKTVRRSDGENCGVFASRSPFRPNKIGLSLVEVLEVKDNIIKFKGVDMLNGTPVLDIKPDTKRFKND